MGLELKLLRYFVAVAEAGQVTSAARQLFVAQPAMTQAIAKLESQVGVDLFARHARGVVLTAAGEALLPKARLVLSAASEAEATVEEVARGVRGAIAWGFTGSPPMVDAPELFADFRQAQPDVDVAFRELAFPRGSTAAWLDQVDVALCYSPTADPEVEAAVLRLEARVVLLAADHPLAGRRELFVEDVLDETFCGYHPALEPERVAFWTLDDHRGGPPARMTCDRVTNASETLAAVAMGRAIATAPARNAASLLQGTDCVTAIPLSDARPTPLTLLWRRHNPNKAVSTLVALAERERDLATGLSCLPLEEDAA